MFYSKWMSYINEDAKITKIAMPGSHNAATKGMNFFGCCQDGTLLEQYEHGVRKFGIRLRFSKGTLYCAHGIAKGMTAQEAFSDLAKIIEKYDDFFILDIRTYPNQQFGPIKLKYEGDPEAVEDLIIKYLNPEKYALTDYDDIRNVTLGDIKKSGKKYIIHSEKEEYAYSKNTHLLSPWDEKVHGYKPEKFAGECTKFLKELESEGFFWFQTQQTPGPGTENGLTKWPKTLDKLGRPFFPQIIETIANDKEMLEKVNVVAGDFMTEDYMKANEILKLNLAKGIVKQELITEYAENIGAKI